VQRECQRTKVIPTSDRLRKRQKPDEDRRHCIDVGDPVPLDLREQSFGIEACGQHQQLGDPCGAQREEVRRCVVERRGNQNPRARHDPEDGLAHARG